MKMEQVGAAISGGKMPKFLHSPFVMFLNFSIVWDVDSREGQSYPKEN